MPAVGLVCSARATFLLQQHAGSVHLWRGILNSPGRRANFHSLLHTIRMAVYFICRPGQRATLFICRAEAFKFSFHGVKHPEDTAHLLLYELTSPTSECYRESNKRQVLLSRVSKASAWDGICAF